MTVDDAKTLRQGDALIWTQYLECVGPGPLTRTYEVLWDRLLPKRRKQPNMALVRDGGGFVVVWVRDLAFTNALDRMARCI